MQRLGGVWAIAWVYDARERCILYLLHSSHHSDVTTKMQRKSFHGHIHPLTRLLLTTSEDALDTYIEAGSRLMCSTAEPGSGYQGFSWNGASTCCHSDVNGDGDFGYGGYSHLYEPDTVLDKEVIYFDGLPLVGWTDRDS